MIDVTSRRWHGVAMTMEPLGLTGLRPLLLVAAVGLTVAGCGSSGGAGGTAASPSAIVASQRSDGGPMSLTSPAFADGDALPVEHTCDGADRSPPLAIAGVPDGATTLLVVMDDPDAPGGTFDHWVSYDIVVSDEIPAGTEPGIPGVNSFGERGYRGPCPPPGDPHHYVFHVLALDSGLGLAEGETKAAVLAAAAGKTVAEASLTGLYGR